MSTVTLNHSTTRARHQLRARLASFTLARRQVDALGAASRGVVVGCILAAAGGVTSRLFDLTGGVALAGLLLIGWTAVTAIRAWLRPIAGEQVALEIDRGLSLAERVTTAIELDRLIGRTGNLPLAEEQIADAVRHLTAARTDAVYSLRPNRRAAVSMALGMALAIAPWVVAWPAMLADRLPFAESRATEQSEANRLDQAAARLEAGGSPSDVARRGQIAAQLRQAAASLRQNGGNSQRASQDLLRSEGIAASLAPQTGEAASVTLTRIADALNANSATRPVTRALDQQNAAQATAALHQVAASLPTLSSDQRLSVAQALQSASDAARGSDTTAADQLQQAADAARTGDAAGMQQAAQAIDQLDRANQAQHDVAVARSDLEASRQTIAKAGQNGSTNAMSFGNASLHPTALPQASASGASSSAGDQSARDGPGQGSPAGQASDPASSGASDDAANAAGGGSGTGTVGHLGDSHDLLGLAQRQITVPSAGPGDPGSVSVSSQLQTGTAGSAQVDYTNVLPEYRQQAQQVVDGNLVPAGLKQVVKGYFDALTPK